MGGLVVLRGNLSFEGPEVFPFLPAKKTIMADQQFSNHARYHPLYHYVSAPLIIAGLVWSFIRFANSEAGKGQDALADLWLFVIAFILITLVRTYALKVQDRAIRAEEALRHFILTGKVLDSRLRLGQIIALRFASDEEFPGLALEAVEKSLSPKQIKESIRQWRADNHRV